MFRHRDRERIESFSWIPVVGLNPARSVLRGVGSWVYPEGSRDVNDPEGIMSLQAQELNPEPLGSEAGTLEFVRSKPWKFWTSLSDSRTSFRRSLHGPSSTVGTGPKE